MSLDCAGVSNGGGGGGGMNCGETESVVRDGREKCVWGNNDVWVRQRQKWKLKQKRNWKVAFWGC